MSDRSGRVGAVAGALVLLASLFVVTTVRAHGGDTEVRILGHRTGDYDITVRTAPTQPRVGPLHVEVQLIDPEALDYVEGATVTAIAEWRGGRDVHVGPVGSRYRQPWHEMDLSLTESGTWDVHLAIDGPLGRAEVSFRVDVSAEADPSGPPFALERQTYYRLWPFSSA